MILDFYSVGEYHYIYMDEEDAALINKIPIRMKDTPDQVVSREKMESYYHKWQEILKETVTFYTPEIGYNNTPMETKNFHMPFPYMYINCETPYKFNDNVNVKSVRIVTGFSRNGMYDVVSKDFPEVISFNILETGEIEIMAIDSSKFHLEHLATTTEAESEEILKQRHEKYLYNFVYDLISTMDHLNNSEYVVTKHSTNKTTGERLNGGIMERRIKIKRTKYIHSAKATHTGTKHRYKYRVRGHWREVEGKEKIWIKDHVRGGDGTIFIPKEYEIL